MPHWYTPFKQTILFESSLSKSDRLRVDWRRPRCSQLEYSPKRAYLLQRIIAYFMRILTRRGPGLAHTPPRDTRQLPSLFI